MKIINAMSLTFLMMIFSLFCPVYAETSAQPTDAEIVSTIKSEISAEAALTGTNVSISSQAGRVTLSGNVNTDAEASKIVEIAESTTGVTGTDTTQLTVKESKQPWADTLITAKVKGIYIREKLLGDAPANAVALGVHVETTNGIVYLSGAVDTEEQASNAVRLANSIEGVKSVQSKIEVKGS